MKISISESALRDLVVKQLSNLLHFETVKDLEIINSIIPQALERLEYTFSRINNARFWLNGNMPYFNVFHTDQYAMFLYYLSRIAYKHFNDESIAERLYYLNKILHSIDIYYEVELPSIFLLGHAIGSVLGRASYSDYLCVSQECTIGNNKGRYPRLRSHVSLLARAMVIGDCTIGENSIISAGTLVKDQDIPANSLVFGMSPNLVIKENMPDACADHWIS